MARNLNSTPNLCLSYLRLVGALNQSSGVAKRASTSSVPTKPEPEATPVLQERRARPSERSRIAGYLASKLSNLTGLSGNQTQATKGSSSAPPSPLNRPGTSSSGRKSNSRSNNYRLAPVDYAGCDFILLLDKPANGQASSSTLPMLVHLVAPNMQEKAAWLSDISQVSVVCVLPIDSGELRKGTNLQLPAKKRSLIVFRTPLPGEVVVLLVSRTYSQC